MSVGRRMFSFLTLMFAVALFTTVTVAQDSQDKDRSSVEKSNKERHRGGRGDGFRGARHRKGAMVRGLDKLALTEPQKSQIETLKMTFKNGQLGTREEARSLKMKMREGTATESDKIRMQELRAQQRETAGQLKNSILNVLTEEQRQQLKAMGDERRQRMEQRRQRFMERKQQKVQPAKTEG